MFIKKDAEINRMENDIPEDLKMIKPIVQNDDLKSNFKQKLEILKKSANDQLLQGNNTKAIELYQKLITDFEQNLIFFSEISSFSDIQEIYVIALSNCAQAFMNLGDFNSTIIYGKKAISINQDHIKSYFRVAKAYRLFYKISKNV